MQINTTRLKERMLQLGEIGGEPEGGITRPSFSPADLLARELVGGWMGEAGLTVDTDVAGNLIGRRAGKSTNSVIILGSHIDTVPKGGMFDGALGVVGAIEVAQSLQEQGIDLNHSLEVVAFADEEGSTLLGTFGSRAMLGLIPQETMSSPIGQSGLTIAEALRRDGRIPEQIVAYRRNLQEVTAYLELHIEQGAVLDTLRIPIGIVEGIVGINRYVFTLYGRANHAGTTPMSMRQDALVAASKLIVALEQMVIQEGEMVGTVGKIEVQPGAVNVIPGQVVFTVELRSLDVGKMQMVKKKLANIAAEILPVKIEVGSEKEAVFLDQVLQGNIRQACRMLSLPFQKMSSGAGHDAMSFASCGIPTAMIFVPSKDGISHSPEEWTHWRHIEDGVRVLGSTLLLTDKQQR